jgi:hypothetical protein
MSVGWLSHQPLALKAWRFGDRLIGWLIDHANGKLSTDFVLM